jgi:hypothetical protein
MIFVPHKKTYTGHNDLLPRYLLFYTKLMFVPHRKQIWVSTVCYGDKFTLAYVDDIRVSQETYLWASTACYWDSFTLYI